MALTKRNVVRGSLDKNKLRKLYEDLAKGNDPAQVQREMGFTNRKEFETIIDQAGQNLPPKQRKKLAEAKETIKTMDDLSSVLNRIFKESGSELDDGYLVFSFGGKNHHYFQIGQETEDKLQAIQTFCDENDVPYIDAMASIIAQSDVSTIPVPDKPKPASKKKRPVKRKIKK